jgi:hypothetical protein
VTSLLPLACPACGRPVPIGAGDVAHCRACDSDVAVPPSHRELRAIAELDRAARARADAIVEELTRPPSWFMRFWLGAGMASVVLCVVLLVVWILVSIAMCIGEFVSAGIFGAAIMLLVGLVLGIPLLYDEALHGLAEPLGVDLADVCSGAGSHALLGL